MRSVKHKLTRTLESKHYSKVTSPDRVWKASVGGLRSYYATVEVHINPVALLWVFDVVDNKIRYNEQIIIHKEKDGWYMNYYVDNRSRPIFRRRKKVSEEKVKELREKLENLYKKGLIMNGDFKSLTVSKSYFLNLF